MLVVPAYAKVNLALEVTGRRPDGWHDLASVVCTIDWHDLVGLSLRDGDGGPPRVRLSGPFAEGVPADPQSNLAARAATLLLDAAGVPGLALDIWLSKQVPAAAGLGGGSADAAAVLRAAAALLAARGAAVTPQQLGTIAAELGSDVPAVLAGGTLLATGRGEVLRPLPAPRPALHLAVAVAGASATAAAYGALTEEERRATGRVDRLLAAMREERLPEELRGSALEPGACRAAPSLPDDLLGSALEPAACRAAPGLADSLQRLRATTPGTSWHLTGSGGAAFAAAASAAEARRLAGAAQAAGFRARACRTVATRLGPLPQAA